MLIEEKRVFMEKEMEGISKKTLESARKAGYLGKKMYKQALTAEEEGRPTAWAMVNFAHADLILKAMGVEIVYPENWGAYCASRRRAEEYLENSDSEGFPTSLCGYARVTLGYAKMLAESNFAVPENAPGGGMARPVVLLSSGVICDARFKWFQALKRYMDVPIYTLEIPNPGVREASVEGGKRYNIRYMAQECRSFIKFMEERLGRKLDWDKLRELVGIFEENLRTWHAVDQLRKAVPSPMLAQDFYSCMLPLFYMSTDPETTDFVKELYREVKERVDKSVGAIENEKYRMMFGEIPPWHSMSLFDDLASEYGIAVVTEGYIYHFNIPPAEEELENASDIIERICYWTYNHFVEKWRLNALKMNVEPGYFVQPYLDMAQEYNIDGAIFHTLLSCRPACYTMLHTANLLREKLNIPSIFIEGDMVDLRVFNEQEAKDRIGAFLDTMDHYKELRKNV